MRIHFGLAWVACVIVVVACAANRVHAQIVRGVDLSAVPSSPSSQNNDDLYEPDPTRTGGRRFRADAITIDIDTENTLMYAPAKNRFYIRYQESFTDREGRNTIASAAKLYGPVNGDPFPLLLLDDLLAARATSVTDQARDRVNLAQCKSLMQKMLANGDPTLAMHGVKLMGAILGRVGTMQEKAPDILLARRLLTTYPPRAADRDAADLLAAVNGKLESLEASLDRVSIELPANQYISAADVQPAAPKNIPADCWGPEVNGMRLAAVPRRTTFEQEQPNHIYLVMQNVSTRDIKFSMLRDLEQSAVPKLKNDENKDVPFDRSFLTFDVPVVRYLLKPGERIILAAPVVTFTSHQEPAEGNYGSITVIAPAGEYRIGYSVNPQPEISWEPQNDGSYLRVKGEWHAEISTGMARMLVLPPGTMQPPVEQKSALPETSRP